MKPTIEQKALAACREYVRLNKLIRDLSSAIGGHLHLCFVDRLDKSAPGDTHLAEAYRPDIDEYRTTYMRPDEIAEFLREKCPHCLAAHELIQQRKVARLSLGAAKRQITKLGKVTA